jgi:hypothetical protein
LGHIIEEPSDLFLASLDLFLASLVISSKNAKANENRNKGKRMQIIAAIQ